jgi:hypothetical protein
MLEIGDSPLENKKNTAEEHFRFELPDLGLHGVDPDWFRLKGVRHLDLSENILGGSIRNPVEC